MWYSGAKDTYYLFSWEDVVREQSRGREFKRLRGYLLADSSEETLPQYVLWYQKNEDTYYSSSWEVVQTALKQGREYWGQSGYILKSQKIILFHYIQCGIVSIKIGILHLVGMKFASK